MHPLVSVVIPSYNHEPFVGESVKSILDQTYPNFEIVMTDDGSRDGTPDVVRGFRDPRIEIEVFPENRGAAVALNSAIRRSRGEFLCMLSSDDFFLPGKLEKQVAFLTANPGIAAVFGMPRFIDERGEFLPGGGFMGDIFQSPFKENLQSRQDWLRYFFFRGNCLCHPTVMVRRSAYDDVGLFNPRLANLPDLDMWVRLCVEHDIHVMSDELIAMRVLENNRNMSAPRRDAILRHHIEYYNILKHYRRLPRCLIVEVFARDIDSKNGIAEIAGTTLLAQLSLSGQQPAHKLLAIDILFEQAVDGDYRLLHDVTGSLDVFGIDAQHESSELRGRLVSAQSEIDRLSSDLSNTRSETARLAETQSAAEAVIGRLAAMLAATKADFDAFKNSRFYKVATAIKRIRSKPWRFAATLVRANRSSH